LSIFDVTNSAVAASAALLSGLAKRQLAWTFRLSRARVLPALESTARTFVVGAASTRRRTALAELTPGLRLELFSDVFRGTPTASAVRIAALRQRLAELLAFPLSKVRHVSLL